uniref:Bromo domain-containing protein n=1 Tax=Rhizophora mucronata TaxID=61149 RepID=A0A2P2MBW3_RHIMU
MGGKASKKSSTFKTLRPQRAAARNALTLFTKITGSATDGEDEDDSEGDLSESESTLQGSNIESAESDRSLQHELNTHSKGKEVSREESEGFVGSRELPGAHVNVENRRRLVLKLPIRSSNKISLSGSTKNQYEEKVSLDDSSFISPKDAAELNGINISPLDPEFYSGDANCRATEGYNNGDIKWGGVKARTSKHQRVRELMSSGAHSRYGESFAGHGEENNLNRYLKTSNDHSVSHGSEVENSANKMSEDAQFNNKYIGADNSEVVVEVGNGMEQPAFDACADETQKGAHVAGGNDNPPEHEENLPPILTKLRIRSKMISRDSVDNLGNGTCDLSSDCPADMKPNPVSGEDENNRTNYVSPNSIGNGLHKSESRMNGISRPALDELMESHPKKMYNVVYRRSKPCKNRAGSECDGHVGEGTSYSNNHDLNARANFQKNTMDGFHRTSPGALTTVNEPNIMSSDVKLGLGHESEDVHANAHNDSVNLRQLSCEERGSSSRMLVGLRSTRNRRTSYNFLETSPEDWRRLHQLPKRGWLMLSRHEGSRYIPQLGDKVVYLRQGHEEYIEQSSSREVGPWKVYKGNIRAVEFCEVVDLEYSSLAGSGDSCCKMTLKFIDPDSSLFEKSFRLTLPEVTGFPDFLVEKTRYDAAIQRNWTNRDKCRVWWKNDGEEDGSWWDGRVISVQPKSSEFPNSPWDTCSIRYKSDPTKAHLHSPWELFDADTQWEQPRIDDETRDKLLSAIVKLDQSARKAQDYYGVQKLRQVSHKSSYTNRFPVPLSLEVIQLRLENHYYRSLNAVKHDFKVMLSNAESYFAKNAEQSTKLRRLSNWLTRTLSSL